MRKILLLVVCLSVCFPVVAQTIHISGTCIGEEFQGIKLYARAIDNRNADATVTLSMNGAQFEGDVPVASNGFYHLYGATANMQAMVPLYLPDLTKEYGLKLHLANSCLQADLDENNQALSAFNSIIYTRGRHFWQNAKGMNPELLLPSLKLYTEAVDSIITDSKCAAPVAQFLRIWAYNVEYSVYQSLPPITEIPEDSLPFTAADLIGDPSKLLDVPMAIYFPSSAQIIIQSLPKTNLDGKIAFLRERYASEEVRKMVEQSLISKYIRSCNFDKDYDRCLKELTSLTEKYALDATYLKDFKLRKASAKGSAFPEDIILTDTNGNKVNFDAYKGYYVYVDMWASWCGPCCKEAPFLIQLEKELGNKDVKFVSISIDQNEASWRKKMKELGLHGNQLLNKDNKLGEALNVRGIPFFLIYDKEGKLYKYGAPRPSSADIKELLENLH